MKKQNKKLITLLLAGALCCSAAIGVASLQSVRSFADEAASDSGSEVEVPKYDLTKLFTTAALVRGEAQATLQLGNEEEAGYRNSVALKWFANGDKDANGKYQAQYFNLTFALADANFKSVTLSMDSASSVASEKGKATNKIKFTKTGVLEEGAKLVLDISVIADDGEEQTLVSGANVAVGEKLTLSLTETTNCEYSDQFEVVLTNESGASLGTAPALFKNIGANYAAYSMTSNKEKYPLQFRAETEEKKSEGEEESEKKEYEKTKICIYNLNGQKFDEVEADEVEDTAAPVLVVNEEVKGFLLGAPFSWTESDTKETVPQYVVIDVVRTSISAADKKIQYYQYNPEDTEIKYSDLTTSKAFMPVVYTNDQGESTTVYRENNGEEFVSISFTLSDSVHKNQEYQLVWYADEEAIRVKDGKDYIVLNLAEEGAKLAKGSGVNDAYVIAEGGVNKYLTKDPNTGALSYVAETENGAYENSELCKFVNQYNDLLAAKAADIYAGSNAKMQFPTLEGLFYDDNGYRNLTFTICYKTKSSDPTVGSSNLAYSALELKAATPGLYEVKIFATDKADNAMKFYLNGELVEVNSSNVWDIDAIPTFTYTVNSQGLKIQNEDSQKATARTTTKSLGQTYSFSGITVVGGAESQQSEFALYRVDLKAWGALNAKSSTFTSVNYKEVREYIEEKGLLALVGDGENDKYATYFDLYLDVYATFLAEDVGVEKSKVLACFKPIKAYNDRITEDDKEWNEYNKYEFQKSSKSSFKVVDDGGVYIMFADYYDDLKPAFSRVSAYKVIKAEEKADVIKGETEWLKNNLVSVILFSIAAVMLILIIILLLIKPSDETLEEVDEKAKDKKAVKKKKGTKK